MPRTRVAALLLLTVLPVLAEATVLRATGLGTAQGLAPQLTAPSPFGVFHDLRWVLVYHYSWVSFAAESAAAIVVRGLLNAGIVALVWGDGEREYSWWQLLRMNLLFNVLVYVVLSPWAAVAVSASGTSLFWFALGEVVPLLFLSLVLQRGGVLTAWWRHPPSLREAGWALITFLVLTADSLVVNSAPPGWARVVLAAAAGAANAWLWRRLVVSARHRSHHPRFVPAAPIAILISAAALLGMGQFSTLGSAVAKRPPPHLDRLVTTGISQQLVYVAGYDSALDRGTPDPHLVFRYSYRGLQPDGRPAPYGKAATHQSLGDSARLLAQQVDAAHRRTGRPVALVAQSEGTLVVRAYLTGFPHPDVDAAVLLSPLVRPGRVYFPAAGRTGWGTATGWLLRRMFAVVRATSRSQVDPDEPFVRSVLDHAPRYRDRMLTPVPGVREIAFLPFAGAAVVPPSPHSGIPLVELPGLHASLLGNHDVQQRIAAFLRGEPAGERPGPGYAVISRAGAGWEVPPLAPAINPAWQ